MARLYVTCHYNALQQTAIHCITLQHAATHDSHPGHPTSRLPPIIRETPHTTLRHIATHCIPPQHTATHCNTMQHIATHCNIRLPSGTSYIAASYSLRFTTHDTATRCNKLQQTASRRNTLPCTAAHCNMLQHTATCCSTLQHAAAHDSRPGHPALQLPPILCDILHTTLQHAATHCNTLQHTTHIWDILHRSFHPFSATQRTNQHHRPWWVPILGTHIGVYTSEVRIFKVCGGWD